MRVRMRVNMSGTRNGERWPTRGQVVDLPDREAKRLIANGLAAPADGGDVKETAVQPTPEKRKRATKPRSSGLTKAALSGDSESD